MSKKQALIVGALGGIGRNLIDYLSTLDDWEIIGLARREPNFASRVKFISVDLLDRDDVQAKLSSLSNVTHIFYTAFYGGPTFTGPVTENLAMLTNVVDAIEPIALNLERITLMQGGKVYGRHLGEFKTPAKESDPRHMPPNFYYDQEDFLRERQQGKSWTWTALRPEAFCSEMVGIPSLPLVIAVYASISKELGLPLRFPGTPSAYHALCQVTDAGVLAKASVWAATEPTATNEAFNITNGDAFRWENLWVKFAQFFEMEYAPPQTISLIEFMADKEVLWNKMIEKYHLNSNLYQDVAAWALGDFIFRCDWDVLLDTTKAQRAGFHEVMDSEAMFLELFEAFRRNKVIP